MIFDLRSFNEPLKRMTIDRGVGALNPMFDRDTGVLALCGKGETSVKFFEITEDAPYLHQLTVFNSTVAQTDVSYLPKHVCDVKECEIIKMIKLTNDTIDPISFKVPRTRKEFFQDDIFPLTRQFTPLLSASEFFSGKSVEPNLVSLRPEGMKLLSEAPKKQISVKAIEYMRDSDLGPSLSQQKEKVKDEVFDRIQNMISNQNVEEKEDDHDDKFVDSDEWDD